MVIMAIIVISVLPMVIEYMKIRSKNAKTLAAAEEQSQNGGSQETGPQKASKTAQSPASSEP